MLWRSSKSATPLQSAVAKNASVNPLECTHANSLDLKSPGMNSYKKGRRYPPVEAPVKPSKTKTSGLRSRAGVLSAWLIFPTAWRGSACHRSLCPCSLAQSTSLASFPLAAELGFWRRAHLRANGVGFRVAIASADGQVHRMGPDRQLRGSAYVVYVGSVTSLV